MAKQMTDVEKSIYEESDKINTVKKIVKARSSKIDNSQIVPDKLASEDWKDKKFSCPQRTVRVGTVFIGIYFPLYVETDWIKKRHFHKGTSDG